jgi:hypothetical protein
MEMTEYGKHGKPGSRLPTLFGNPFGIPTFPTGLDCWDVSKATAKEQFWTEIGQFGARDL